MNARETAETILAEWTKEKIQALRSWDTIKNDADYASRVIRQARQQITGTATEQQAIRSMIYDMVAEIRLEAKWQRQAAQAAQVATAQTVKSPAVAAASGTQVRCPVCGQMYNRRDGMSTWRGTVCPDCYDRVEAQA